MERRNYIVYIGRNSPVEIPIMYNDAPMDFNALGITKVGVVAGGSEYDSDNGYVDFTTTAGTIIIKLGNIPNPPKNQKVPIRIVMYSTDYPLGLVVFSEKTDTRITLEFI